MAADVDSGRPTRLSPEVLREQGCGRRLGRFTILRKLAQGGMAEIYLARAPDSVAGAHPVAVKKILPQLSGNKRFVDMLKDEAKITVSLTHPNIVQVYELGVAGEDYFLVMEYVQGRPLNQVMQRVDEESVGGLPIAHAVYVMQEVAKGLDHAHRQTDGRGANRNIVHRDVSPQNVLIAYAGDVKLIDFGIARAEGRVAQSNRGGIKGKLRYLAPEIADGREPDLRADIFCCGIVLYEMLSGEPLYRPASDAEAIALASLAEVRSPRARNPDVPAALDDIVMRALRKSPDERFDSAHALQVALQRFLRSYEPSYGEDDLAGYMRSLFRPEIVAERSLDAASLDLVESMPDESSALDAEDVLGDASTYQQVVTRFGIGGPETSVDSSDSVAPPHPTTEGAATPLTPVEGEQASFVQFGRMTGEGAGLDSSGLAVQTQSSIEPETDSAVFEAEARSLARPLWARPAVERWAWPALILVLIALSVVTARILWGLDGSPPGQSEFEPPRKVAPARDAGSP